MKTRITSLLLILCTALILFSFLPVTAQAETEGDWEYEISSGLATVTKYNGTDAVVTIPDAFGLYQVTSIGSSAFEGNVTLTQINFPKGLTSIGSKAFKGCIGLTEVNLPAKLTTLGARAFENCTWLNKVTIACTSLNDIKEEYSLYGQPFRGAGTAGDGIEVIFAEGCTRVPRYLFHARDGSASAANVTSVTMADTVTWVGGLSFLGCVNLETVNFGNGVDYIGNRAFEGCTGLKTVTFSNKLTTIGDATFKNCTVLQDVAFPASLTDIGANAFEACISFKSVTLPEKLANLGARAFQNCTQLAKITVKSTALNDIKEEYSQYGQPFYGAGTAGEGISVVFADGCTKVPNRLFHARDGAASAANVTSVTMADTVTSVGGSSFWGCVYLETVDFGNGVTYIGVDAFNDCSSLQKVTFSQNLKTIAGYAFDECTKLENVEFPNSLQEIGEGAFWGCTSFTSITLPEKLANLGARAFQACSKVTEITINCTSLNDIKEEYELYGQPFYGVGAATDGVAVEFAEGCTKVPRRLFHARDGAASAANVTSVTMADTVTWVGGSSFWGCVYLETVDFGDGVTYIGEDSFNDCSNLQKVTFSQNLETIAGYAFDECTKLENVEFPNALQEIGEGAFWSCASLESVTLPSKLASLGARAFQDCKALKKITVESVSLNNIKEDYSYYGQPFYGAGTSEVGIEVIFADGCTRIPANLFHGRDGISYAPAITSITVADTVTEVGSNAFTNCGELETLRFMGSNPAIADNAFTGVVANGYHPGWPDTALLDYGGDITWELWDAVCDHAYTELRNAQAATCTEDGYTGDTVCVVCGEALATGETVLAAGHTWDNGEVTLEPTPTEPGEMTYTCQSCGETKTEVIGATACDHTDTELQNEKAATCSEEGYTGDMVCTACGEIIEPGEPIPVTDHVTELQNEKEATCFEEGYTGDTVCTVCGTVTASGEAIAMVDHSWDAGEVTREPTATEPGEMTFTCTTQGCGETRTEEIAPSACAHNNTELKNAVEATCTLEGYTGDTICTDCGETVLTGEVIPVKDHIEVIDKAVEPTCKETGLTEGKHCEVCGEVLVKQETVDKLPHKFEGGSCTDCGEEDPDWEEPSEPTEPSDPTEPTDPSEPDDDIVPPVNPNVIRIAGTNRFETAFKVADQMKKNLGLEKFDAIIVASGTNFPDALSGSYLAAVKRAPILLSFNEAYNDQAKNYIRENLAADGTVYLLGSVDVVPETFEEDLEGFNVKRLAGPNRFDTNLEILKEVGVEGKEILVCSGLGFADSLSASATELPILLVWNDLFENQKAFLEEYASGGKFCIIGGETAVSKQIERQIGQYGQTRRVGGTNRFMTSVMIAETFFDAPASAVLAYAWNYPDGLCGGALASTMDAPLILTMTKYENAAAGYIQSEGIDKGAVLGGTGLISDEAVKMIFGEPKADPGYTVTFDSMGGSPVASQTVEKGKAAKAPAEPTREGYAFLGWYPEKKPENFQDAFQFEGTEITKDITLYAVWLSMADTDGDQLADGLEEYYGTDINNPDTDGDTVSDYIEVVLLGTDPLKADADLDTDGDTLSNAREIELGTDPSSADSDMDGLADNEELELGTDPMNEDTDGDGVSDGKEVEIGTDPLTKEASFAVAVTAEAEDTVTASVQMTLSGEQVESLSVEPILDTHLFPKEMPGYMGQAYDFRVEGEFETAIIQFEFDPSTLGEGEEPAIFYFNEEEQELEELETTVEGNIATAEVTHFSTYVLINSTVYYDAFAWEDVWESNSVYDAVELVFAIDDSGSMGPVGANNDPQNMRLSVARDLVDKLPGNSKIGVVWFAEEGTMLTPELITDRDAAKDLLTTKYFKSAACSHTSMYDGINVSFDLFQSTEDSVLRMLVVLSDGIADDTHLHNSVIDTALANNVKIYSVGLGSSTQYFNSYMKPLAEQTGGSFYLASQADELAEIYADINKEIDLQTNSDKDSIPDYYEDNMYSFNGLKIEMDKYKEDTDGDGLMDDEEIEFSLKYNEDMTRVYVKGKLKSYPHLEDSDDDGIMDKKDTAPLEKGLKDGIIGELTLVSCYNSETAGWTSGHVFFVYTSYIKDKVDFSTLAAGWSRRDRSKAWSWENLQIDKTLQSEYAFSVGESVSIGNGAFDSGWFGIGDGSGSTGGSSNSGGSSGNSTASGTGDENGVCYNMEVYKHFSPGYGYAYLNNTYISEDITEEQLKDLITYCSRSDVNYWNLTHNCAEVACQAWNRISDTTVSPYSSDFLWGSVATPKGLKINLRTIDASEENYSLAAALK